MKTKRVQYSLLCLAILCVTLSGCSTNIFTVGRSYHPRESTWNLGYSDTQIAADSWRVSYRGYGIAVDVAADYALYRAAQLCLASGFPYFVVEEDRESSASQGAGVMTGGTAVAALVDYPTASITIQGFAEKPIGTKRLYETKFIYSSIKQKYGIKE